MWEITSKEITPAVDSLYALAKSRMPKLLEAKFAQLPVDLIQTHGRDLTINSQDPSRSGTPAPASAASATTSAAVPAPAPVPAVKKPAGTVNTTTITAEATFMAAADDLFSLLTDEKRIPSWTRAVAQVCLKICSFLCPAHLKYELDSRLPSLTPNTPSSVEV